MRLLIMGYSNAWGKCPAAQKHPSPSSSIFTTKITSNRCYLVGVPSNDPSLNTSYKDFVRLIKQMNYKPATINQWDADNDVA